MILLSDPNPCTRPLEKTPDELGTKFCVLGLNLCTVAAAVAAPVSCLSRVLGAPHCHGHVPCCSHLGSSGGACLLASSAAVLASCGRRSGQQHFGAWSSAPGSRPYPRAAFAGHPVLPPMCCHCRAALLPSEAVRSFEGSPPALGFARAHGSALPVAAFSAWEAGDACCRLPRFVFVLVFSVLDSVSCSWN